MSERHVSFVSAFLASAAAAAAGEVDAPSPAPTHPNTGRRRADGAARASPVFRPVDRTMRTLDQSAGLTAGVSTAAPTVSTRDLAPTTADATAQTPSLWRRFRTAIHGLATGGGSPDRTPPRSERVRAATDASERMSFVPGGFVAPGPAVVTNPRSGVGCTISAPSFFTDATAIAVAGGKDSPHQGYHRYFQPDTVPRHAPAFLGARVTEQRRVADPSLSSFLPHVAVGFSDRMHADGSVGSSYEELRDMLGAAGFKLELRFRITSLDASDAAPPPP